MGKRRGTIILILLLLAGAAATVRLLSVKPPRAPSGPVMTGEESPDLVPETPDADEPRPGTLTMAVHDPDGLPITGVVAELFRKPVRVPPQRRSQRKYLPREGRIEPDLVVTGAADGRLLARDLATGVFAMVVRAPGFATREMEVRWVSGDDEAEVLRIELSPEAVLEGRVLLLGETPLAGVEVLARKWADELDEPDLAGQFVDLSDDLGRYRLAGLSPGIHELWTRRPGGSRVFVDLLRVPEISRLDLELTDGAVIRGRVTDSMSGRPVCRAEVRLLGDAGGEDPPLAVTTTDDDGRYLLRTDREFAETAGLLILSNDHRPEHLAGSSLEYLRDREQYELDVALLSPCRISGRVTAPAGPVAEAEVTVWVSRPGLFSYHEGRTTTTAEDGTWSLSGLAPGIVGVTVVAEGLLHPAWREGPREHWIPGMGRFPEDARCRVDADTPASFDIVLEAAPVVEAIPTLGGSVRDEDGNPIAFARVTANDSEATATDRRGRFSFDVLCDSRQYTELSATQQGYDREHWSETLTTGRADIEIVLPRARVIRGRVVSNTGGGVAGAVVTVGRELAWSGFNFGSVDTGWDEQNQARVEADGTFEVLVLDPHDWVHGTSWGDEFVVCVEAGGHRPAYSEFVTFKDKSREAEVSLILEPAFEVRGSVFSAGTGEPLTGAAVRLTRGSGGWPPKWPPGPWEGVLVAVTDATGAFVARDVAPGHYEAEASFPGLDSAHGYIDVPADQEHRFELLSYRSLGGVVLGPDGDPVARAEIFLVDEETGLPGMTDQKSDANGQFRIERVPDRSEYVLAFPDQKKHPALGPALVGPVGGENHSLRIVLPEGLEIRGQLLDLEGRGLAGVEVSGNPKLPLFDFTYDTTDDEGRFRLRGLAAAPYDLLFREVGVTVHEVAPGTDVIFRLPGGETIAGIAIRKERAFGRLALEAVPEDPRTASGLTFRHLAFLGEGGRFEFRHLAPGDYRIDIHPKAGERWWMDAPVDVPAGAKNVQIRCRHIDDD